MSEAVERMKQFTQRNNSQLSGLADMVCSKCNNSGWEGYYDDEGRYYCRPCSCGIRQKMIMQNKLLFAEVPEKYREERLKDFTLSVYGPEGKKVASEACHVVKYWLDNLDEMFEKGKGLYFVSKTKGSGKTKLATSIANELIYEKNKSVKFCTSMAIINAIKESWHDGQPGSEAKLISDLGKADFLIIDDFGTEKVKDWVEERFYTIMNQRYVDRKVTIITSNHYINNLPYDERVRDRITQCCFEVPFPEESVRKVISKLDKDDLQRRMKDGN